MVLLADVGLHGIGLHFSCCSPVLLLQNTMQLEKSCSVYWGAGFMFAYSNAPFLQCWKQVFHEGANLPIHHAFRLSPMAVNELLALLLLGPLIQANLQVSVAEECFYDDASPYGGALCRSRHWSFCG